MHAKHRAGLERFVSSALIALPITAALLFLMTRLILPGENDRIVTRMIQTIEFERKKPRDAPATVRVFETPATIEELVQRLVRRSATTNPEAIQRQRSSVADTTDETKPIGTFDWQNELRKLADASDEKVLDRWLLEQGHERYVSIMQGPLPITNSVRASLPPTQDDATGYTNSYGDKEYRSSENCTTRMQVAARLDISDFAQKLPMVVTCKKPAKEKYTFDRYDDE